MKTVAIKTPTAELMIVEVPKGFQATEDNENYCISLIDDDYTLLKTYSKEYYTALGKPDEIREEDAMEVVHEVEGYNPVLKKFHKAYRLYNGRIIRATHTAKESLLSLLESEIYWNVNPIPTPEVRGGYDEFGNFHGGYDDSWISDFEEDEQKTFIRNRTLIFKKN